MQIEKLVYACSRVGIRSERSGGQIYSWTEGMEKMYSDGKMNIGKYISYRDPVDEELAPLTYTYNQMLTLFPKQFRYEKLCDSEKEYFAFSVGTMSIDYTKINVQTIDKDSVIGGRGGAHEFYILVGEKELLTEYPYAYYMSEDLEMPFEKSGFSSEVCPGYMYPSASIKAGNKLDREEIKDFVADNMDMVRNMLYYLLRYDKADSGFNYNKNLVICDNHSNIINWIAALQSLLPESIAAEISFSTYEYDPSGLSYRICGAFPKGTAYKPTRGGSAYIFDIYNQVFENEVDTDSISDLYSFLVNTFVYSEENIAEFFEFYSKFKGGKASIELESAYELFTIYKNESIENTNIEKFKRALDFSKHCEEEILRKKIFVMLLNMVVNNQAGRDYKNIILEVLNYFKNEKESIAVLCVNKIVEMLKNRNGISILSVKKMYKKYEDVFEAIGINIQPIYYKKFIHEVVSILKGNKNLELNAYGADMITDNIKINKDISKVTYKSVEGQILYLIVANIVGQSMEEETLRKFVIGLTCKYKEKSYDYLYFILLLEGIVNDFNTPTVNQWMKISDKLLKDYIAETGEDDIHELYETLTGLNNSERVVYDIERRGHKKNGYERLQNEILALLKKYPDDYEASEERLYRALHNSAMNSDDIFCSLCKFIKLRKNSLYDDIFIKAVHYISESLKITDDVDKELLYDLLKVYGQNGIEPEGTVILIQILTEMESYIKNQINNKEISFSYMENGCKKSFPLVTEEIRNIFIEKYAGLAGELYIQTGNIALLYEYNHLFDFNDSEIHQMVILEIQSAIEKSEGRSMERYVEFIAYIISDGIQVSTGEMARILKKMNVNLKKLDKCMDEKNKAIVFRVHRVLKKKGTTDKVSEKLLVYWNNILNEENGGEKNIMKKGFGKVFGIFSKNGDE